MSLVLCRFVTEIQKLDGSDFPPRTLCQIIICVQFQLEKLGLMWKVLDDKELTALWFTLDNIMKRRCQDGLGNTIRQAQVLSYKDEEMLWSLGILGTDNPTKLVNMLVFVLGINCALRAGKEHRSLRIIPLQLAIFISL